jgi:hypothetical protein
VIHLARGDRPPVVDRTDHGIVTEFEVVEELFAELVTAVEPV